MPDQPAGPNPKPEQSSAYAFAMSIGAELVGAALGGFGLGWLVDKFAGTYPWGVLFGSMFGITVGLYQLIRASQNRQAGR